MIGPVLVTPLVLLQLHIQPCFMYLLGPVPITAIGSVGVASLMLFQLHLRSCSSYSSGPVPVTSLFLYQLHFWACGNYTLVPVPVTHLSLLQLHTYLLPVSTLALFTPAALVHTQLHFWSCYSFTMFFVLCGIAFPITLISICYALIFLHVRRSKKKIAAMADKGPKAK